MIYNIKEVELFERMLERKALERSIYDSFTYIPEEDRKEVVRSIDSDISRCNAMVRLALNDFSRFPEDFNALTPNMPAVSSEFYEHYLEGLNDKEREDEAAFFFCKNLATDFYIRMMKGRQIAEKARNGGEIVSDRDIERIRAIYDCYMGMKRRCEENLGNEDLPYAEASRHIDHTLEECSILMRGRSKGDIDLVELCSHIDGCDSDSPDSFNKLFLPDFDPKVRGQIVIFQDKADERLDLLYALLIFVANLSF